MTSEQDYPPNIGQGPEEAEAAAAQDEAQRAEIAALNDRILRLAAELENTRRRAEREKQDASRYAIASFARDLLAVADNFERAIAVAPEPADEATEAFLTGVKMNERMLAAALARHGVRRLAPEGEKFDPNLHQAVAQAPTPGVPAGHVAAVAQPGFVIGDRVLRAAMVVVSTGEPEPADAPLDTTA